ncbi:dihydrofolate reductase family protein [Dactylosporangium matsuzakiense]|uniref:Deaminase reductase n=1 Tax=Dactylosporangium matsuzakiense TaxID=53360 RepID=A0A9W6KPX9_9ACTN|nr:dihydrofolate reductase family protein [Dactylosporangium matsuzakiense]GLL05942.1 deaminase reductase [Dactylosporangium matsuzakiense]
MRLTVMSHLTLDGVVQSNGKPEPELGDGFKQGGWQVPYLDQDLVGMIGDWITAADAFLFGRGTYTMFAGHWPLVTDPDDPIAARLNGQPKYVVSTTLQQVGWAHSTVLRGDVAEEVAKVKEQTGNELQLHGSATLLRTLMQHGLVDEYRLFVHPVVLGNGNRLFEPGTTPTAMDLVDIKTTSRGVAVQVYRPAGEPHYGAVAPGASV